MNASRVWVGGVLAACVALGGWGRLAHAQEDGASSEPEAAASPQDSLTDEQKQARAHYLEGKERYAKGDFDGAIEAWEKAYKLAPNPALHFNVARAHEQAGHVAEAVERYKRYISESQDASDRPSVEATIGRLQEMLDARQGEAGRRKLEDQAAVHFRKGRELYNAGRYQDALDELKKAYTLLPSATLVYNMAKIREKLGDYYGAAADYRRYLEMEPKAPDRGDVEHAIARLESQVRQAGNDLSLETNPPGADVFLDDSKTLAGQTPLTLKVAPGPHRLRVSKNGHEENTKDFVMPGDRPLTLTLDLRPLENVGWLTVEADQDGAQIFLDGTILALTPYREQRALSEGRHQVVLDHTGFARSTTMVEIRRGKESHLKVSMSSAEGRSKAPLLLAPMWGLLFFTGGSAAVVGSAASVFRMYNVVADTPNWRYAGIAAGVFAGVGAVSMVVALLGTVAIVALWAVLGLAGGGGSDVIVRDARLTSPAPSEKKDDLKGTTAPAPAPERLEGGAAAPETSPAPEAEQANKEGKP